MRKPDKLSDRALNTAINNNWHQMLSATQIRRFVQKSVLALGLSWAVALPLLNTNPIDTLVGPQGTQGLRGIQGNQGDEGERGSRGDSGGAKGDKGDKGDTGDTGSAGTGSAGTGNNDIRVLSVLEIQSAPASKIWHRSTFDNIGDEFWALPDSSFKLKLIALPSKTCDLLNCEATFEATFDQFENVPDSTYQINLVTKHRAIEMLPKRQPPNETQPKAKDCFVIDNNTPYLLCRLESTIGPDFDVCLWLRRADKVENENDPRNKEELIALEVRWEKIARGMDRQCGGDLERPQYPSANRTLN